MTLSKETLEAAAPAAKTAAPAAPAKVDLSRLRADAVSLDVPVKVHGSRVTEVVRGVTPHTEPFEEETSTMIVFPHGGVVRMATIVNVGQMLVLTNQRTNQDAICRVVKVRAYSNSQAYVEVEFTHRQLGYWGVHFPADDDESLANVDSVPAQPASEPIEKKPAVASVSMKIENLPKASAPAARNESAFATIGSQEEVQPAATQMEKGRLHPRAVQPPLVQATAPQVRAAAPPSAAPAFASQPRVIAQREIVEEDEPVQAHFEPEVEEPQPARTFGTLTGGAGRSAQRVHVLESETHFEAPATAHLPAPRSGNWVWIAACAFFLVAGLAGGALYFRQHPNSAPQTVQSATNSTQAQPADPNQPAPAAASFAAAPEPSAIVMEHSSRSTILPAEQENAPAAQSRIASNVSAREAKPAPTNVAAGPARPIARRNGGNVEVAAPSVGAAPSVSSALPSALPDVLGAANAAPPPPPMLNRVRVGGVIIEPKLLHSVAPVYPSSARQSGITGNVVVSAQVDKAGNVVSTKAVSGPITLQAAAMNAMKLWKYQPATLDAEPIATQVTVTIKFQQQ